MPLSASDVRRIATQVVEADHPSLRLVGVTIEGGSSYTEIILTVSECHVEPCRVSVDVHRDVSEAVFRAELSEQLYRHRHDRQPA
jgi:hypothetical protein